MTAILLIAFIGMVIGFFLIFGISPLEFTDGLFSFLTAKPNSLKSRINEATQRAEVVEVPQEIEETAEYSEGQDSADVSEDFEEVNDETEDIDEEQGESEYMGMEMSM